MSGLRNFFSQFSTQNQRHQTNHTQNNQQQRPQPNSSDNVLSLWNAICSRTLNNTHESLVEIHKLINAILQTLEQNLLGNFGLESKNNLIETFSLHQIPKQLVTFGLGNIPKGLIHEVVYFFTFFTRKPFSELLPETFIIDPMNTLIKNLPKENLDNSFKFIYSIFQYLLIYPNQIHLFQTSEESSPLIEKFSEFLLIDAYSSELGPILISLFDSINFVSGLMNYILTYSPLVQTIIDICKEFIVKRIDDPNKNFFLQCICNSIESAPYNFQQVFAALFDEEIIKPLVVQTDAIQSLSLSIYMLCTFTSVPILIEPIYKHILSNFDLCMKSNFETIIYLTIRCITLMIETSTKIIFYSSEEQPESVKIYQGFMNFFNAEWFIKPDINNQLVNSQSLVSMMMTNKENDKNVIFTKKNSSFKDSEKIELVLDLRPILPEFLLFLKEKFIDVNSLRINLSLTEFFSTVASISGLDSSFFALSDDCQNGLVKSLSFLCTLFERRIGHRQGTTDAIRWAYETFEAKDKNKGHLGFLMKRIYELDDEKEGGRNGGEFEQENLFLNLVIVLEFLKELQAIAQSKNIFHLQMS